MDFKFKNCKINISFLFSAFLALTAFMDKSGYICASLFTIIIHEFGHLFAMYRINRLPQNIKIDICNIGITDNFYFSRNLKDDIFVFISGSSLNFIFCLIFYIISLISQYEALKILTMINFEIAVFNLLPIRGLDGGSILYAVLSQKSEEKKTQNIVKICSFLFLCPLAFIGFLILLESKYNFSLLLLSCSLIWTVLFKNDK